VSRPGAVVAVWGLFLAGLALLLVFWTSDTLTKSLLALAAGATLVLAVPFLVGLAREPEARFVPDLSVSTAVVAIGLSLAVAGIAFGPWLVLLGLGVVVAGLVGVVVESRRTA
jgi:hypothetical protein